MISNIGSFGPEVVKIGMPRRLEPMDRVRGLGDASVPFRFDVHALHDLAGNLLDYRDEPEAFEYRQSQSVATPAA
ncbi:hypothetical protein ABZ342_28120 [Amycolatopsis sp. NPDC005961]|uniref:hypothetical protein n=1 Tax=Amycolatopsis sp. NPDC005961 TaxID=3156720 RepID=UPI0033E44C70